MANNYKAEAEALRKKNLELFNEVQALMKERKEVKLLGQASGGTISLQDLEATVRVLRSYKEQGFTNIQLS